MKLMKSTFVRTNLLLTVFFLITFKSFCQFGEKVVIHEDEGERQDYRFIGAFDFDNDEIEELWYLKNPTESSQQNIILKLSGDEYTEITIPNSDDWFKVLLNSYANTYYVNGPEYRVFDYNNDGFNDIIFITDESIQGLRNEQNFVFSEPVTLIDEPYFVKNFFNYEPVDIDGDGALDLVSMDVNEVVVWVNNDGKGNFGTPQNLLDDESRFVYPKFTAYDINQNGSKELIVPSFDEIEIFTKINGEYELLQTLESQVPDLGISVGAEEYIFSDINGDGFDDLLLLGDGQEGLYFNYYFNNGEKLTERNDLDFGELEFPYYADNLKKADLDNDGDDDYLIDLYGDDVKSEARIRDNWFEGTAWIENINGFSEAVLHHQFNFNYRFNNKIRYPHAIDLYNNGTYDIPTPRQLHWIELKDLSEDNYKTFSLDKKKIIGKTYDLQAFKNRQGEINIAASFDNEFSIISSLSQDLEFSIINTHTIEDEGYLDVFDYNNDGYLDLITIHDQLIGTDQLGGVIGIYQYRNELNYFTIKQEIQYSDIWDHYFIKGTFLNEDKNYDIITSSPYAGTGYILENNENAYKETATLPFAYDVKEITAENPAQILTQSGIYEYKDIQTQKVSDIVGIQFIDIDGDGDQDIIGSEDSYEFNDIIWYENLGENNYGEGEAVNLPSFKEYSSQDFYFFDLDLDNDADFISSSNDSLFWQENLDGKGQFSEKKLIDNITATVVTSADMDQDGDEDLLIGGEGFIYWYTNKTIDSETAALSLSLPTTDALQGDIVEVPVKAGDYSGLQSLSFSIQWDSDISSFDEVTQFGLEGISESSFDVSAIEEGKLGFSWKQEEGKNISDDQSLFVLKLKLQGEETSSTALEFGNEPLGIQARNSAGQILSIASTAGTVSIKVSEPPNDITLSKNSIEENQEVGTLIGNLFSKDNDDTDGFSYALVEGEGDDDNEAFQINNTNQLASNAVFDFEERSNYTVRVETTDSRGKSFQKAFEIEIVDVDENTNTAPTAISLSSQTVDENQEAVTLVGTLSTEDEDEDDTHTYVLIGGEGSDDNKSFILQDDQLFTRVKFDYEEKSSYTIRIQTEDSKGAKYSRSFEILINDVEEIVNTAPTDIALSSQNIVENAAAATVVGELATTDQDEGDSHTYTLVDGDGSSGNDYFTIKENQLISLVSFDYEKRSQTSVRVETKDAQGETFQKSFTIFIEDIEDDENEAPTAISLSNTTVNENAAVNTVVGILSATDADDDEFTFSLVAGAGNADNESFRIEGNQLLTAETFDYELKDRYSIRIQADDGKGGSVAKQFRIDIEDVEDNPNNFPTHISLSSQSVEENQEEGTVVGEFTTTDPDKADTHTYKLIEEEDYAYFRIEGKQLLTNTVYDYEKENLYIVKVQTDDGRGGTYAQSFVINVIDVESEEPINITLSSTNIEENKAVGTLVGILSAGEGNFEYTLVSGEGDDDNGLFAIADDQLLTDEVFDFEVQQNYTIRVKATDENGNSIEHIFTISITDVNDNTAPTVAHFIEDQTIATNETFSFAIPSNTFSDVDPGDALTYTATLGNGDPLPDWLTFDTETFTLSGTPPESGNITVRITATDPQGGVASDEFVLTIEGVTAIPDEVNDIVKIYPNPVDNFLIIESQNNGKAINYCRILDKNGKELKAWKVSSLADLKMDLINLPSGTFIIEVISGKDKIRVQVLKK